MAKDLKKIKDRFNTESEETKIKEDFEKIENDFTVYKFNPDNRSLSALHDILDNIQDIQTQLGKLKAKALKEEARCELCFYDCKDVYDERYDDELNELKGNETFKNAGEKTSHVKKLLRNEENNIEAYVKYFEKKKIKIKSILKRIETYIKVVDEMDDKSSRKISLMNLQRELGTLVDIKMKRD